MSKGQGDPQDWSLGNDHTVRADLRSTYCGRGEQLLRGPPEEEKHSRSDSFGQPWPVDVSIPNWRTQKIRKRKQLHFYLFIFRTSCLRYWTFCQKDPSMFLFDLIQIPGIMNMKSSLSSIFGLVAVLIMLLASSLCFALYRKPRPYGLYSDSDECYRLYLLCDLLHWWSRWLAGPQDFISYSIRSTSKPNHVQTEGCLGACFAKPLT